MLFAFVLGIMLGAAGVELSRQFLRDVFKEARR